MSKAAEVSDKQGAHNCSNSKSAETFKLTGLTKTCDNLRLRSSQRKRAKQDASRVDADKVR
jgi:hypothetical protein